MYCFKRHAHCHPTPLINTHPLSYISQAPHIVCNVCTLGLFEIPLYITTEIKELLIVIVIVIVKFHPCYTTLPSEHIPTYVALLLTNSV